MNYCCIECGWHGAESALEFVNGSYVCPCCKSKSIEVTA